QRFVKSVCGGGGRGEGQLFNLCFLSLSLSLRSPSARIGKMKRRKPDDGQVCPLCSETLLGSEEEMSRHVDRCLAQREGSFLNEEDSVDVENENRFEEYEWCGQKRIRATTLLEGGFRGSGFVMCNSKENHDSDADLDVDGDDTLEYGKPQYPFKRNQAPRTRVCRQTACISSPAQTSQCRGWTSSQIPSTSNGESSKLDTTQKTCKNSEIEKITEDSAVTTFEALKARIRELERQLARGDRYKCLICMDSYTMPLTSIQCWHVHCEECWLRTLVRLSISPLLNLDWGGGGLPNIWS
uniref:Uncharacterized protein n=1 Tax=Latimeria chalumnae TaxID=7897 RepID=H2ZT24_LATCH